MNESDLEIRKLKTYLCYYSSVHVDKNGLVYPYKKKMDDEPKQNKKVITRPAAAVEVANIIETPIITDQQIITEPIFTITEDGTLLQQQPIHEVHYIQEPFMESVTIDENGTPAVIHYIQLQDTLQNI